MQMNSTAVIEGDYRYELIRSWDLEKPLLGWIMLNPSTADTFSNDPTVRECIRHARHWGYGGIKICNLFAFRASRPAVMMKAVDPIGPKNNEYLLRLANTLNTVVLAWGAKGIYRGRSQEVLTLLYPIRASRKDLQLKHLGTTTAGEPVHPLGVLGPVKLLDWKGGTYGSRDKD